MLIYILQKENCYINYGKSQTISCVSAKIKAPYSYATKFSSSKARLTAKKHGAVSFRNKLGYDLRNGDVEWSYELISWN